MSGEKYSHCQDRKSRKVRKEKFVLSGEKKVVRREKVIKLQEKVVVSQKCGFLRKSRNVTVNVMILSKI